MKTIAVTFLVTGCSWNRPIEVQTTPVELNIPQPNLPREIDLKEPYWYVVSEANVDEFLERIKKENAGQIVFFAMSVGDYELMAYNMQELKRYIKQLKEVVVFYKEVTTDPPKQPEKESFLESFKLTQ